MAETKTRAKKDTEEAPKPPPARPPLTTTVIGSWSVPDWLERAKTADYQGGIAARQLRDIHEVAIKAAIKDQESAGIDVVSDGELRRDNESTTSSPACPASSSASR